MNILRQGKDIFERLTTLKVVRLPEFPFISVKRRFLKVRLDFTSGCNLRCVMCPTVAIGDFEKHFMPPELFSRIARQVFPRTEHLTIGCGAEPLMSGNLEQYLQQIKSFAIPYTLIISNGSLLTEEKANFILDAGINELSISLESADKDTYESIRKGAKFDRLVENLRRLNQLKKERQTERPALAFNVVLMKSSIGGLPSLIDLAKSLEIKTLGMAHLIPFKGLDNKEESLWYHQDLANRKIKEAMEYAESAGIGVFCPPLFGEKAQGDDRRATEKGGKGLACVQPWTFMIINSNGKVTPCGWLYGEDAAASFRDHSFRQIWFSDMYAKLREEIRSGNLRPGCARCPAAGLGDVNCESSFEQVQL